MDAKKIPYIFSKDEVNEMLERSESRKIKKQIYENVKGEVERTLWKTIVSPNVFSITDKHTVRSDSPSVYIRKKTLLTLLDSFREQIGEKYLQILSETGEKIGLSFGEDLIRVLREKECIPNPKDHMALLETWVAFDSSAGMGWISIEKYPGDEMMISIEDNFLTFGYSQQIHRFCKFFEGYISGTLNELFHEFYEWIAETSTLKSPEKRLSVISVQHATKDSESRVCSYRVLLTEDFLVEAHGHEYAAVRALQLRNLGKSITETRSALETCVKRALHVDPYKETSFYKITKEFREKGILQPNLLREAEKFYSELSRIIHGKKVATFEFGRGALDFCRFFSVEVQRATHSLH